jgi:hypothetical protein
LATASEMWIIPSYLIVVIFSTAALKRAEERKRERVVFFKLKSMALN